MEINIKINWITREEELVVISGRIVKLWLCVHQPVAERRLESCTNETYCSKYCLFMTLITYFCVQQNGQGYGRFQFQKFPGVIPITEHLHGKGNLFPDLPPARYAAVSRGIYKHPRCRDLRALNPPAKLIYLWACFRSTGSRRGYTTVMPHRAVFLGRVALGAQRP